MFINDRDSCKGTVEIGYFVFFVMNLYIESIDF